VDGQLRLYGYASAPERAGWIRGSLSRGATAVVRCSGVAEPRAARHGSGGCSCGGNHS
jgi:hypothetical protein